MRTETLTIKDVVEMINRSGLPQDTPIFVSSGPDRIRNAHSITPGGVIKRKGRSGTAEPSFDVEVKKPNVLYIS